MSINSWNYKEVREPEHYYVFLTICPMCGSQRDIMIEAEHVLAYQEGALIQNAFVNLDVDEREAMMTGFCSDCFPSEPAL